MADLAKQFDGFDYPGVLGQLEDPDAEFGWNNLTKRFLAEQPDRFIGVTQPQHAQHRYQMNDITKAFQSDDEFAGHYLTPAARSPLQYNRAAGKFPVACENYKTISPHNDA